MYPSSPFRSTLNMGYITGLDMCKVCTEAVLSVALWTRVTLGLDMCALCTEPLKTQKSARGHTARYQRASNNEDSTTKTPDSTTIVGTDSRTIVSITNKMETVMLSTPHPPHPTLGFWIRLFWLLNPWLLKIVVVESGVLVVESGFAGCWSLGCWIVWLLKPAFLVAEAMVAESGCFGCWIRLFWLLNPALLVAEALVVECFGCWFRLCWLLKLWLSNPSLWLLNPAFWFLNLSCWIRVGCWIRFCSTELSYKLGGTSISLMKRTVTPWPRFKRFPLMEEILPQLIWKISYFHRVS